MSVIQVIDEDKKFTPNMGEYFKSLKIGNAGLDYDVVAVFGSQSTGKSTLLNALFGTEFGVMDVAARRQTTKGIWMGAEKIRELGESQPKPLLVLDVEGTDGRERGEDQDFERKAALFALATSEVLIINMWEHQVGLYVGANMALLRTVFEVNLSLFQAGRGKVQRSRLLFAIRDYIGLTPLETLAATLTEDLVKQWDSVSKPEGLEESQLTDFFDLDFVGLPNKMLQPAEFSKQVADMLNQIKINFHPQYHRSVPLDGWPMYAEQVWQQIEMNKDLDLPTHQILVARFRCEEIANTTFTEFEDALKALNLPFGDPVVIPKFGELLRAERSRALSRFDEMAGRYHQTVYKEKRLEFLGRVDGMLSAYFTAQLIALKAQAVATFKKHLASSSSASTTGHGGHTLTFKDRIAAALASAQAEFVEGATDAVIDPSFFSYHSQQEELDGELLKEAAQAREVELRRVLKRASKRLASRLEPIELHFNQFPDKLPTPWDAVEETLNSAIQEILNEYPERGLGLGGSPEEIEDAHLMFDSEAWRTFAAKVANVTAPDAVLQRMRDRFEDVFKYTPDGLPIVWAPGDDIEAAAVKSRQEALALLPVYSKATLSSGQTLAVPQLVAQQLREAEEDVPDFGLLLSAQQQQDVERRFQRVADSAFIEAKRSVMQLTTHIPLYIYAVIVVLGWNEFTMVLRNPLLLLFVLIIGGGAYVVWNLGMAGPVLNVLESSTERAIKEGKEYIRQLVLTEDERSSARRRRPSTPKKVQSLNIPKSADFFAPELSPAISPTTIPDISSRGDATLVDTSPLTSEVPTPEMPTSKVLPSEAPVPKLTVSESNQPSSEEKKLADAYMPSAHAVTLEDVPEE